MSELRADIEIERRRRLEKERREQLRAEQQTSEIAARQAKAQEASFKQFMKSPEGLALIEKMEDGLYETVAFEIANREMDPGLWARALSDSEGDEKKTQAAYIKLRVDRMKKAVLEQAWEDWKART